MSKRFFARMYSYFKQALASHHSPHEIALSAAVGAFIGIMPGLGTLAAILVAVPLKLNKPAAALGSFISNPFTVGPLYALSYKTGGWLVKLDDAIRWHEVWSFQPGWWAEMSRAFPRVVIGLGVTAIAISAVLYGVVRFLAVRYQSLRHRHDVDPTNL